MENETMGVYELYMGDCQNYGPFLGPYYNTGPNTGPNLGDPKRDHNFDKHPYRTWTKLPQLPLTRKPYHSSVWDQVSI